MSPADLIIGLLVTTACCYLMWQWVTRDLEGDEHDDGF